MRYQYLLAAALWLTSLLPGAADWPQWRGPHQTGYAPSEAWVPTTIPASPKTVWRVKAGEGLGSPVMADGKVVYLDAQDGREVVNAINASDGKSVWKADLDELFKDSQSKPAPRSTPLLHDGLVYVQSCRGTFKCLNASNGETVWEINFKKDYEAPFFGERGTAKGASRHGYCGSPVIKGDDIFVAVGGTNGASIVCFNRKTGQERWRSRSEVAGYNPVLYARLAGKDQVIHFSVSGVMGLNPSDGSLLWKVPESTTYGRHVITPVVHENMLIISTHKTGLTGIRVQPEGNNGFTAAKAWVNKKSAINITSPVAVGQHLYGVGPRKNFICVDITTGEEQWSHNGPFRGNAGGAYAGLLVLGESILALANSGTAILFAANAAEYEEIGRAQLCGANWCNPAYADGQLYLRDTRNLYRINLKP